MTGIDDTDNDRMIYSRVCLVCKHCTDGVNHQCKAFVRIPDEIWECKTPHDKHIPGDHGYTFERR